MYHISVLLLKLSLKFYHKILCVIFFYSGIYITIVGININLRSTDIIVEQLIIL